MAFIQVNCFSEQLERQVSFWVLLPQKTSASQIGIVGGATGKRCPLMYLLHGLSDDHTTWMRRTSIERYADESGMAVVMPCVDRSFYADMAAGPKYYSFVSQELPQLCAQFFGLEPDRARTFVAGLSMGGYGAFKLALSNPHAFCAAASLSGSLVLTEKTDPDTPDFSADFNLAFGADWCPPGSGGDLLALASALAPGDCPRLYQWCGTEDFLYRSNAAFRDHARSCGLPLEYSQGPGGHEWRCWDEQIGLVIGWFLSLCQGEGACENR